MTVTSLQSKRKPGVGTHDTPHCLGRTKVETAVDVSHRDFVDATMRAISGLGVCLSPRRRSASDSRPRRCVLLPGVQGVQRRWMQKGCGVEVKRSKPIMMSFPDCRRTFLTCFGAVPDNRELVDQRDRFSPCFCCLH